MRRLHQLMEKSMADQEREQSTTGVDPLTRSNVSRTRVMRQIFFSPEEIADAESAWEEAYEEGR